MPERIYWDANVPLNYVEAVVERVDVLDEILSRARKNEIELLTSIVSQVEVAFAAQEKEGKALDPDVEAAIDELWAPTSPIRTVELYSLVADQARKLIREGLPRGWSLKPMDAIHLATAQRLEVAEFQTYDIKLHRYEPDLGFRIREPTTIQLKLPGT